MNLPRSTYYYRSARTLELTDGELTAIIEDVQDELPCYGYRRVTHELRRRGFAINHKRVARVMRVAGLGIKPRKRSVRTTDSRHDSPIFPNLYRNLIPDRPDRVWVADFTYIRVVTGFCYLAAILDACSRKVIGYALSQHLDTELVLAALPAAVMIKTLKVEEVYRAGYETFADVAVRLPIVIEQIYNTRKLHSALGYRTPEEFETLFAQKAA